MKKKNLHAYLDEYHLKLRCSTIAPTSLALHGLQHIMHYAIYTYNKCTQPAII